MSLLTDILQSIPETYFTFPTKEVFHGLEGVFRRAMSVKKLAQVEGLEPPTQWLTATCSTAELHLRGCDFNHFPPLFQAGHKKGELY